MSTVGGGGTQAAGEGGPALEADLLDPAHVVQGPDGLVYFADRGLFRIRRITADGRIETVAGNGEIGTAGDGGPATEASLGTVLSMSFSPDGSLYWLEQNDYRPAPLLRRLRTDGVIETVAGGESVAFEGDGGPAREAGLYGARNIAIGPDGSIYIASRDIHRVRRIGPDGVIETIAGDTPPWGRNGSYYGDGGPAVEAGLDRPEQVLIGPDSTLYVGELNGSRVRRITPDGRIDTYLRQFHIPAPDETPRAEDPVYRSSSLYLGIDTAGRLYWQTTDAVRRIGLDDRFETVWTGERDVFQFGVTADGRLWNYDAAGLYELVEGNERRPVAGRPRSAYSGGDGGPARESILVPQYWAVTPDGEIYVYDAVARRIRRIRDGVIEHVAGDGSEGSPVEGAVAAESSAGRVRSIAVGPDGDVFLGEIARQVWRIGSGGIMTAYAGVDRTGCDRSRSDCGDGGPALQAPLGLIESMTTDANGALYVVHSQLNPNKRIEPTLRRIAPDGTITTVELSWGGFSGEVPPFEVTADGLGRVFVLESAGARSRIFRLDENGAVASAQRRSGFDGPWAIDSEGRTYEGYVHRSLVRFTPDGERTWITSASQGPPDGDNEEGPAHQKALRSISSLRMDADDNLYVLDSRARRIRRITRADECAGPDATLWSVVQGAVGAVVLAPGTIFSLYGDGVGPESAIVVAPDDSGRFPVEVEGVRVLIGGMPAPLLFVSETQINGVAPDPGPWLDRGAPDVNSGTLGPRTNVPVVVERPGLESNPVAATFQTAAPALFIRDSGFTAALNQDGSLNTQARSAAPGSVIVLFGSGAGPMEPFVPAGRVVSGTPLPRPTLPVSLTIGGEPAEVLYAGAAPELVSGVLQVNARVPENLGGAGRTRVVLTIGGYRSGQSVDVAVGEAVAGP